MVIVERILKVQLDPITRSKVTQPLSVIIQNDKDDDDYMQNINDFISGELFRYKMLRSPKWKKNLKFHGKIKRKGSLHLKYFKQIQSRLYTDNAI